MEAMYAPQNNGPHTAIAKTINSTGTSITVEDASVLPAAPNVLTIGTSEDAELVLLESVTGNILTVQRGFNGTTSKEWEAETWIYRAITAQDVIALQERAKRAELYQIDLTADELAAMTTEQRIQMYASGTRMIRTTNGGTVVLLMLSEDGKVQWSGGERPRNLLANSDFLQPVNQRGETVYIGAAYTIDCWKSNNLDGKIEIVDGGIAFAATGSGTCYFVQTVPDEIGIKLSICTKAVKLAGGEVYASNNSFEIPNGKVNYFKGSNGKYTYEIAVYGGNTVTLEWAGLFEGKYTADTLPPYHPKGYMAELLECQRYYYPYKPSSTALSFHGWHYSTSAVRVALPLPVEMDISSNRVPTISLDTSNVLVLPEKKVPTSIQVTVVSPNMIMLTFGVTGTQNDLCAIRVNAPLVIIAPD